MTLRHSTIRQLQVFVEAAETLSFARVAERLGLTPAAVVGPFDPGDDRQPELLAGVPALPVQDVPLHQRKKSMAALSPQALTWRAIDQTKPLFLIVRTKATERPNTSLAFTEGLLDAGSAGSIASVGDALDNAVMESTIGPFKTELIDP